MIGTETDPRLRAIVDAAVAAVECRRGAVLAIELGSGPARDRWQVLSPQAPPDPSGLAAAVAAAWTGGTPAVAEVGGAAYFVDPLLPPPRLVVAGGGHIGRAIATLGALIGWETTVVDNRAAFADAGTLGPFGRVFADLPLDRWTSVVCVTPGYLEDIEVLGALSGRPEAADLPYIGVIGSRRRLRAVRAGVAAAGAAPAFLAALHAPIGLDLGAESPQELALAIVAEALLVQRGGSGRPVRDLPGGRGRAGAAGRARQGQDGALWRRLSSQLARGEPVALACVVAARGSTPRRPGARMLVFADGTILGSTGGGVGEGQVRAEALAALRSRVPRRVRVDLTHEAGSSRGGICGGYQEVWIEPLGTG